VSESNEEKNQIFIVPYGCGFDLERDKRLT
jgi:hypothetical protein